jgi:4-amino-4-deoxy-L-arabinose transferase-like glycosyltransferase
MKKTLPLLEIFLTLSLIASVMLYNLDKVEFHPDESHWIGLSAPFEAFFKGRFEQEYWQNLKHAYLNPPVTYYAVGLARRLGGYRPGDLNPIYDFNLSAQENIEQGRIPSPDLLWWGRLGVTICAILGIWIAFWLLKQASGRAVAYAWLVFLLLQPYFMTTLRRAMNEGVLVFFVMAAIGAAWMGLKIFTTHPTPLKSPQFIFWLVLAGLSAGLAGQTKTNGAIVAPGIWLVFAAATLRVPSPWRTKITQAALVGVFLLVTSLGAFLGANPTLWANPLRGTQQMLTKRTAVMARQVENAGKMHIDSVRKRVEILSRRLFSDQGILPQPMPNSLFFLAGLVLTLREMIAWLRGQNDNHALVVLVIAGFIVGLPSYFTPLDWERYYLPISFFFSMVTLLGARVIVAWLIRESGKTVLQTR